jgi:flagellar biogenesis protein FliO
MSPARPVLAALLLCLALPHPGLVLADASAEAPRSNIPFKQEKHSTDSLAYQSIAGLVLAGLAAYGIILGLKRQGGRPGGMLRKTRHVQVIEATRLGRRGMLYLVEYRGQELLLAEGEQGIQLLSTRPLTTEPSEQENEHA